MTQRFAKNSFSEGYKKTIGADFLMKKKYIKTIDKEIEFMIWDTAVKIKNYFFTIFNYN
jgi:GTPase SAR1 family protein